MTRHIEQRLRNNRAFVAAPLALDPSDSDTVDGGCEFHGAGLGVRT